LVEGELVDLHVFTAPTKDGSLAVQQQGRAPAVSSSDRHRTTASGRLAGRRATACFMPLASPRLALPPTISDFERRAAELMPAGAHGYYAGGAGDEITLRDNVSAWQRLALRPRVMVDCSERDPSTTVLGRRRSHPLIVAPTAFHTLATAEGETATA